MLIDFDLSYRYKLKKKKPVKKPFLKCACDLAFAETVIALPVCRLEQSVKPERKISVATR